jgi:hypothetical protein
MRAALAVLAAAILATSSACTRKPATWKEWIDQAPAALKAQDFGAMLEACRTAFDIAHEAKNGPQAVLALECMAEAASADRKLVEKVLPAYAIVLRDYDDNLRDTGGGLRVRNNYAAALVEVGRKQEGVELLNATLDAYEGTPHRSAYNFRIRMQIVANLARAVRVFPDSEAGIRASVDLLQEITNHLDNERFRDNLPNTLGAADALFAIAELIRLRGDPKHGLEVAELAKEQQGIEDAILAGAQRRPRCDQVNVRSLVLRPCWASIL